MFNTNPLSASDLAYYELDPWEQIDWNLNPSLHILSLANAFENVVCKLSAILFRLQCV